MTQKSNGIKPQTPKKPSSPNKPEILRKGGKINEGVGPKSPYRSK